MTSGVTEAVANYLTSEPQVWRQEFVEARQSPLSLLDRILRSHEVDFRREIGRPVDSLANERGDTVR
jgi:hypothetical protein